MSMTRAYRRNAGPYSAYIKVSLLTATVTGMNGPRSIVLVLVFLNLLSLALAGPRDNSLVLAASREPPVLGDFWGFVRSGAVSSEIENFLWARLEYVDIDGEDRPYLATEVPTVANGRVKVSDLGGGKKRIDIRYTLRDDVYWSDGAPVTSADVEFYYQVGKYPGAPVPDASYWRRVSLRVLDARNFVVSFAPAYSYDLSGSAVGLAPAHVLREKWRQTKAALAGLDPKKDAAAIAAGFQKFVAGFATPEAHNDGALVYSGPFVLQSWAGGSLEMVRNPRFFITPPGGADKYVRKVTYRFITDPNALLVAILGGDVDATSGAALSLEEARAPQLTRRAKGRFDIWAVPGSVWEHLEVNKFSSVGRVKDLLLDKKETRQAILYALNRRGLSDAFFDGLQPPAASWVHFQNPNYDPDVRKYPYDPERAAEMLAELGWRDLDGDGYLERRTKDGRTVRFVLEYVTTAGNRLRERTQEFFKKDLAKVGIRVEIHNEPAAEVFSRDFLKRAYAGSWKGLLEFAWLLGMNDDAAIYTCKDYLTSKTYLPTPKNDLRGYNFGWCNHKFDELRAKALAEFDPQRRRRYWREMQKIWAEELPALPLYWRANPLVVRKGLVNYAASAYFGGFGYPSTNAWLIGWKQRGAQQVFDQARYAANILEER